MAQIGMSYTDVEQTGRRLGRLADDINNTLNNIRNLYTEIDTDWTGIAATRVKEKLHEIESGFQSMVNLISEASQNVAKSLQNYQAADEANTNMGN